MVAASTKQVMASAKPIVLSSRLRYKTNGSGGAKPVLVSGLGRAGGHSNAIVAHAWDRNSIGASHATPVLSTWMRVPENLTHATRVASVNSLRQTFAASRNWGGTKQSLNVRPALDSPLRFSTNQHAMPAKILPRQILRIPIESLGR